MCLPVPSGTLVVWGPPYIQNSLRFKRCSDMLSMWSNLYLQQCMWNLKASPFPVLRQEQKNQFTPNSLLMNICGQLLNSFPKCSPGTRVFGQCFLAFFLLYFFWKCGLKTLSIMSVSSEYILCKSLMVTLLSLYYIIVYVICLLGMYCG